MGLIVLVGDGEIAAEIQAQQDLSGVAKRVRPEGTGQHVGPHHEDTSGVVAGVLNFDKYRDGDENTPVPRAQSAFKVRLGGDDSRRNLLHKLCHSIEDAERAQLFEVVPDSSPEIYRCLLCPYETGWWPSARSHFEDSIDDEQRKYKSSLRSTKMGKEALREMSLAPPMKFLPVAMGPHVKFLKKAQKAVRRGEL
jgi:hypothetical protein